MFRPRTPLPHDSSVTKRDIRMPLRVGICRYRYCVVVPMCYKVHSDTIKLYTKRRKFEHKGIRYTRVRIGKVMSSSISELLYLNLRSQRFQHD